MNKTYQIAIIWSAWQIEYPKWAMSFDTQYQLAYQAWYLLAKQWCYVLTGWKSWIMEWAAKWCREWWWVNLGFIKWSQRWTSNEFVDIEIVTNMWDWWDAFLIPYSADWAIVIWWGVWTLKEIAWFYLQWKPIVAIRSTWWFADEYQDAYIDTRKIVKVLWVDTVDEWVKRVLSEIKKLAR